MRVHVVMTLLVRDEIDIIAAHIRYHLAAGVGYFIVTDNGSVDGTVEVLERFERQGVVRLIHQHADDYSQHRWVSHMARLAAAEHDADWVVNSDADEFWCAPERDLRVVLEGHDRSADVVEVPRFNFLPTIEDGRPFWERMTMRMSKSVNELGEIMNPKACHRADPVVDIGQGNHIAQGPNLERVKPAETLEILHFPMRSFDQFDNKIARGGAAYERNRDFPAHIGQRWRELYRVRQERGLSDLWDSWIASADELERGLASGEFVEDRRLVERMDVLGGAPQSPGLRGGAKRLARHSRDALRGSRRR